MEPNAPENVKLKDALRSLARPPLLTPREVDEAILGAARERLARRCRWSSITRAASIAAAAAVVLAVTVWMFMSQHHAPEPVASQPAPAAPSASVASAAPEDVNGDGQVDILDALALARRIESGQSVDRRWDLNADGAVTRADVDRVAMVAVNMRGR